MSHQAIEAEFPELREYPVFSAEWYRAWRSAHLARYPESDRKTRLNLDEFVRDAEARESAEAPE